MKICKYLLCFLCFCYSFLVSAQVTKVTDPTWLNQEKRQVFEDWADFKPDRHWFWGDLTYNWALVWGYLAPAQNRRYRRRNMLLARPQNQTIGNRYFPYLQFAVIRVWSLGL